MHRLLVAGKTGQVGNDLGKTMPAGTLISALGHHELDITSQEQVSSFIETNKPDVIINCAAYTAVDKAESEQDKAYATNAAGVGYLAEAARDISARFIHFSTDFVFDGRKSSPYQPQDPINPLSVYGKSKAEGERLILETYPAGSIIIRTSWVYSSTGNNFVKTMLRLMRERDELRVVMDQTGSPTWSQNLARTVWVMVMNNAPAGIYHWSDSGTASWYDFAVAIYEEARSIGLLEKKVKITPIPTSQYPTPATRPAFSVMDTSATRELKGVEQEHWRSALRKMLLEYQAVLKSQ